MPKRARPNPNEIIAVYWGISSRRKQVETVYGYRNGRLTGTAPDGSQISSVIAPGRNAESEVRIVFGLQDIFVTSPGQTDSHHAQVRRGELMAKAEALRAKPEGS